MLCNRNVGTVGALDKQHPGKFKIETRPAKDHPQELKDLGIESHGVVCRQGDKVLWQHGNHVMSAADFAKGVETVLAAVK